MKCTVIFAEEVTLILEWREHVLCSSSLLAFSGKSKDDCSAVSSTLEEKNVCEMDLGNRDCFGWLFMVFTLGVAILAR
jgi:hypothetical protein